MSVQAPHRFCIGQQVLLNSDGPLLKVAGYRGTPTGNEVHCKWIDLNRHLQSEWLAEELLEVPPLFEVITI